MICDFILHIGFHNIAGQREETEKSSLYIECNPLALVLFKLVSERSNVALPFQENQLMKHDLREMKTLVSQTLKQIRFSKGCFHLSSSQSLFVNSVFIYT